VTGSTAIIFEPYLLGLRKFARELATHSPALPALRTFEQRLLENVRCTLLAGNTDALKAERSQIIYELNALAYEVLNLSFNELCDLQSFVGPSTLPQLFAPGDTGGIDNRALRGWGQNQDIATTYSNNIKQFLFHVGRHEYEEAKHIYWRIIYFVGTRELWNDCRLLSSRLLKLADREEDSRTKGLVLITGKVWPLLSRRHLAEARIVLSEALDCLHATASSDLAMFYEYMADIEAEEGSNTGSALSYYREALARTSGIDAHKVRLKMMFAEVKSESTSSRSRLIALHLLRDAFRELKSYREGLVLMEIARSLHALKSVEALEMARLAYSLLNDEIMMPSNAKKARRILNTLLEES